MKSKHREFTALQRVSLTGQLVCAVASVGSHLCFFPEVREVLLPIQMP